MNSYNSPAASFSIDPMETIVEGGPAVTVYVTMLVASNNILGNDVVVALSMANGTGKHSHTEA